VDKGRNNNVPKSINKTCNLRVLIFLGLLKSSGGAYKIIEPSGSLKSQKKF
jgi:hypothetical protein